MMIRLYISLDVIFHFKQTLFCTDSRHRLQIGLILFIIFIGFDVYILNLFFVHSFSITYALVNYNPLNLISNYLKNKVGNLFHPTAYILERGSKMKIIVSGDVKNLS